MTVIIVGCGMAGLLAANMLRHRNPVIWEIQPSLPNNHSAVLRFRTSAVGDVLNIPFKKVKMIKDHVPWSNSVADALAYSYKNSGKFRSDRSITMGMTVDDRWIAPTDLITRMAEGLTIHFDSAFNFENNSCPIISTLPMPALRKILMPEGSDLQFNSVAGVNLRATIADCDAYVSLLVPDPEMPFSRISLTGDEMIVEMVGVHEVSKDDLVKIAFESVGLLGIPREAIKSLQARKQTYAKITPIDDDERKSFMHWATIHHDIYSLGRFATWRPNLLLDDLINDIRKIDGWLGKASKYDLARDR